MILQRLQFPEIGEDHKDMYYRWYQIGDEVAHDGVINDRVACDRVAVGGVQDCLNKKVFIYKGCELNFNTYFNAFSIEKWVYYTNVKNIAINLKLKGTWEVCLTRYELNTFGAVDEYHLNGERFESDKPKEITIAYRPGPAKGLLSFKLKAIEDSEYYGGAYTADIDEYALPQINLALGICTYKREGYIAANLKMLNEKVFGNKESMLRDHLSVYIADNGNSLKIENDDRIKIYPNLNSGGAGGFSRAMIEAFAEKDKLSLTHMILMDDDVVFTEHALERTYVFLRLLKPAFKNSHVGGAMLKLSCANMQHAAGETYSARSVLFNKGQYDMRNVGDILRTELLESTNHLAWWFFCFSIMENTKNDLALPIFFQYDDFDYNLRHGDYEKITTIGICLWHEAFEKKNSNFKNYYTMRNRLIIGSLHGGAGFSKRYVKLLLTYHIAVLLWMYRYKEAHLWLRAVEDYFKGFEWIAAQNPEELNRDIMCSADQMLPANKLPIPFAYKNFLWNDDYKESRVHRFIRQITMNGWLLPAKGDATVAAANPNKLFVAYKKRVLNYDIDTQKGFVTEKSWKQLFGVLGRLLKVLGLIDRKFSEMVNKYREDYPKYITEEFWRPYLGLEVASAKWH